MARYRIGIDLGTTNSALAYVDGKAKGQPRLGTLGVQQLVGANDVAPRHLLPSFLYLPGPHDLPAGACALPWDPKREFAVGEFARNHGARVPGRLVSSAKSWLCHAGVDRHAGILPWSAPPDVARLSPVEASARYLKHLAEAWNFSIAKDRADDRFEKQQVVLTVPASFDDMARSLTVEAARKAGIENLTLLEEPQAAFYCWMALTRGVVINGPDGPIPALKQALLQPGMTCLVIDVGGGTSDFSLIQSVEQEGELGFIRQAVGDHLLLGGDNMDLALARYVETKLPKLGKLDAAGLGQLVQACRYAKEVLLAPNPPSEHTVTVMGRGRQVIGGTLHTSLTPAEVKKTLEDGFFPNVPSTAEPARAARTGLHEMGLPFVHDASVTRHLAVFLRQHGVTQDKPPDAILFNGGVFQPVAIRERILDVMRQWYDAPGRPWRPLTLASPSLDLAVAWGAAYFGWLKHTGGKRIGGGLARSYYVGVQTASPTENKEAVDLLCVVPQHLEEGSEVTLEKPELELALGQPVTFPLYTSTVRDKDQPGQMLAVAPTQLLRLPPLHTVLRGGKRSGTKNVPVKLAARLTEIGTLELFCVARNSDNRWRLEFNTRDLIAEPDEETGGPKETVVDVWPEEKVQAAAAQLRAAFGGDDEKPVKELVRALETALEASRESWPTGLCRRLWDFLAELAEQRRRTPAHLARWYNLVGWCLRPGFGDPLDRFRIEQLWKLLHSGAKQATAAPTTRAGEGGADWWIMWRRVSGGLNATLQQNLLERLKPVLLPSKSSKGGAYKPGAHELAEMWRAAASLERIEIKWKEQLGQVLVKCLRRSPAPTHAFWSLTRLGTRALVYGPLNTVLHPHTVEAWLDALVNFNPTNDSERAGWLFCLAQLAQRTGQLALDVNDIIRQRVEQKLAEAGASAHYIQMVKEGGELEAGEQKQLLGDALPIGLKLVKEPA